MEKINDIINRLGNRSKFQERYEKMRQQVLNHQEVRQFIKKHEDELTPSMINKSLMALHDYSIQTRNCDDCPSLEECQNLMKGYQPKLMMGRNSIDIVYEKCPTLLMEEKKRQNERLIQSMYVPKEIMTADLSHLDLNSPGRVKAITKATSFVLNYDPSKKMKGLYLYGSFGVGKSYIMGAIAKGLADKNVPSMIVYFPELIRELKGAISDHTLDEKIEHIKKQPILMIDDIGAETMSSWTRDEVLGPILQYRMQEYLPTFFTSNFDLKGLEHHLTYSQRGEEEKLKARRIIERIQFLTEPIEVDGPNRRK